MLSPLSWSSEALDPPVVTVVTPVKKTILGHYVIVGVTVFIAAGLLVTYATSVALGHVKPLWCFISYTGNFAIEACIFSLVLSLSAALYILIVFLRYVQVLKAVVQSNFPEKTAKRIEKLNVISLVMGTIGSFGLCMAGCFQQRLFRLLHITGVVFCTYFTLIFFILQTYFTFLLPPLAVSWPLKALRTVVVAASSVILASGLAMACYHFLTSHPRFEVFSAPSANDESIGYKIGSAFEWILFILNQMFICSLFPDFRKIALKTDEIVFL